MSDESKSTETGPDGTAPDHYVTHLSQVNETNEIVSTEDIYNDRGVLLVKQGARINHHAAKKIIQHKLTKPLEEQVKVANSLDHGQLEEQFAALIKKYPDVAQIHNETKFAQDFDLILVGWGYNPTLVQKLTILASQMPVEFEKGLFAAWLSALIAREMALDHHTVTCAFVAGLVHDMGLMHIDPAIVNKKGALTPPEWRAIQSHTVIGKMVLDGITAVDPIIAVAVVEHHERADGIGYPVGKVEEQLNELGQIVGLADSVQAIRVNQFERLGRNLRDALPFLHMNAHTHSYAAYEAICALLRKTRLKPTVINPYGDVSAFAAHLEPQWLALKKVVAYLETTLPLILRLPRESGTRALRKISERVAVMITQSGMTDAALGEWLKALQAEPTDSALQELNEIELMLNELRWQLKNARLAYERYFENKAAGELPPELLAIKQMATDLTAALEDALTKAPRPANR